MNILRINNDSVMNYQRARISNAPDRSVPEERTDVYIGQGKNGETSEHIGPSANTKQLTDEQAKDLSQRYDVTNMSSNEFGKLVNELYKSHVISLKESSMGTAGETPYFPSDKVSDRITKEPGNELPKWPVGNERANFLTLMDSYGKYCKSFADYARDQAEDNMALSGDDYSDYYNHLHRIMQKIAAARME